MKRLISLMVLCLSLLPAAGRPASTDPENIARAFFRAQLNARGISAGFSLTLTVRSGTVRVFECGNPEGFVIVKGDRDGTIAGYSIGNRFTRQGELPDPAAALLETIESGPMAGLPPGQLKTTRTPVGPFLRTTWSQEGFFNYFCPEDPAGPEGRTYVGCAAVAMGQIIRHFGKFNDFRLTASMEHNQYGTLTAVLGNYDWEGMEDRPIVTDLRVSQLLYGLGVLSGMNFSPSGSVTSTYNVYDGFKKLKYFSAVRMIRGSTTPDVWLQNFIRDIEGYRPVYVAGSGHAFVCDGIDAAGLFHFNLGWYGYADGFYPLELVYNLNLSEAIFDIAPYSNNLPPENLRIDSTGGQKLIRWTKNRLTTINPSSYRVYINDTTWYDSHDTQFGTAYFPAGTHDIRVSAIYPQGESCWIGPIPFSIPGKPVDMADPGLMNAILEELARLNIHPSDGSPTLDQLLKIQELHLDQPIRSLNGIENCRNIQVLTIVPGDSTRLDFEPVSRIPRLKWLDLSGGRLINLSRIVNNRMLIHLDLDRTPPENLNFLTSLTDLIDLRLYGFPVAETQTLGTLNSLRSLIVSHCQVTSASFVQSLSELKSLDLSGNLLTRFRLTDRLPEMTSLNVSHNQIPDYFFLENLPNIRHLNLSYNQISRFTTGLFLRTLEELDLEGNQLDSIALAQPVESLVRLNIGHNRIRNIRNLADYAPSLTWLDASGNQIPSVWRGSLQNLQFADLSENRIDLVDDLVGNPSLTHIDVANNGISDIFPVFDHNNSQLTRYLNLAGNPLSAESFDLFAPTLKKFVDTLILPPDKQEFSPGMPSPARLRRVPPGDTVLSWTCGSLPPGGYFEVYTGKSADALHLAGQTGVPAFAVNLNAGQSFFWRIKTILPDTAFLSGRFGLLTSQTLELPFREGFETYNPFTFYTEWSPFWLRAADTETSLADGRIDPYRRSEGAQSLKLANASDIRLPLDYLYQSTLNISMDLLIRTDCLGAVRLNNLDGVDLELYFKSNGRCDIILNKRLVTEIPYPVGEWFPIGLNLYAGIEKIWIRLANNDIRIDWKFTGQTVHAGDLELLSAPGPNWPRTGQAQFNVDRLEIRASGILGDESTRPYPVAFDIFPNPANGVLNIQAAGQGYPTVIRLYDLSGRCLMHLETKPLQDITTLDVSRLDSGIYLVSVEIRGFRSVRKICIHR